MTMLALATAAAPTYADTTALVDPAIQYQPFQGWGTSLAWWAYVVGGFPEPARTDYVDKAFDPVKGLGLNVVRYNIGGGENPLHLKPNKQFLAYRAAVPGYQSAPGVWDWNADAGQRWVLRAAMARGANRLEAFSNSPPYWMTRSGSVTGTARGTDNLKPEADGDFAAYLAGVVQHFHDAWDINFPWLEPLNEPTGGWWKLGNHQEGCHVDRPHQNDVVKATGVALARTGLPTTVSASDENTIGAGDRTFPFYDAVALRALSKINVHSYGGGDRTQLSDFALSAGKDLWLSEYGDGDASGLRMANRIVEDIKGLHPSAWVYWQVVDKAGGWGFLKNPLRNETETAYTVNKKYYVMGNFSKFIRPGYRFIAIADPHSLAAYDDASGRLVIVTTNSDATDRALTLDLSRFEQLGATAVMYRTSPTEDLAALPNVALDGKQMHVLARAKSVSTYVIASARYTGPRGFEPHVYYKLINRPSGHVLEQVGRALTDFTPVDQAPDIGGTHQQWRLDGQGDGVYKLINRNDGLALEVGGAATQAGATVDLYHDKSEPAAKSNQAWRVVATGAGFYKLVNTSSGLVLDSGGTQTGAPLHQSTDAGTASQQWRIVPLTM